MPDKPSFDGIFNRLKQDQVLFLLLLVVLTVLFLVYVFNSNEPGPASVPQPGVSMAQALTLVAAASQTGQAENPGVSNSTNQASLLTDPASLAAAQTATISAGLNSGNLTQTFQTQAPQAGSTATRFSAIAATATPNKLPVQNTTKQPTVRPPTRTPSGEVTATATLGPTQTGIIPEDTPTNTPVPRTPPPTSTSKPADTPTTAPTPTATRSPGLPGLSMNTATSRITGERGFTSCALASSDPGPVLYMCDFIIGYDLWYHVDLYGTSDIEVTNLLVSVFQTYPDEVKTLDLLKFFGSLVFPLPAGGANASAAETWLEQNLLGIASVEDVRETFIGGVRFRLYGGPQGRYLEIGDSAQ